MTQPNYQKASDVFHDWHESVLTNQSPVLYPVGDGPFGQIEIGPGLVTLMGGPPGVGKTAFTMQITINALRLNEALRALVCNIEMPPSVLLDRQLSRLSGIPYDIIRHRQCSSEHAERLEIGMNTLEGIVDRLAFVRPPFNLENVAAAADDFHADMLVLDYIQRIPPPGDHGDKRHSVDATMNYLRQFADAGTAVIVVAAVARTRDAHGRSSYEGGGLNLASFRESSELEFGADDAYILAPDNNPQVVQLRKLKSRYGETANIRLRFDGRVQSFVGIDS